MSAAPPVLISAAAAILQAAAPAPPPLTFETVSHPLPLAQRLLGRAASEIVEAQAVPAPGVAQWSSVQLYYAPHAHATGWAGLCRLEMQHVALSFVEPRDQAGTLMPSPPDTMVIYALTRPAPDLHAAGGDRAANEAVCHGLTPFLNRQTWRLAQVRFGGHDADPAQAAFAFRALAAARTAASVHLESCPQFSGRGSAACVDPRAFLRALDLRDLFRVNVAPCGPDAANLCVTAAMNDNGGSGFVEVRAEMEDSDMPPDGRAPRLRAIAINAGEYPVA